MGESKLTVSVHLCDFLGAELLINNAKLFDSPTEVPQGTSYPAQKAPYGAFSGAGWENRTPNLSLEN